MSEARKEILSTVMIKMFEMIEGEKESADRTSPLAPGQYPNLGLAFSACVVNFVGHPVVRFID